MFDAKRLLDQLIGSGAAGGFAGGLAGGALANVLAGKKAKKLAGSALKVGGLALVGGLAYKAWQNYQQGNGQPAGSSAAGGFEPPPADGVFLPQENDAVAGNALSMMLARAMISAAKADGQIDTRESQVIMNQINGLDLPAEDKGVCQAAGYRGPDARRRFTRACRRGLRRLGTDARSTVRIRENLPRYAGTLAGAGRRTSARDPCHG